MSHQNFTQIFARNMKIKLRIFQIEKLQKIPSLFKNEGVGIDKLFFFKISKIIYDILHQNGIKILAILKADPSYSPTGGFKLGQSYFNVLWVP